MFGIAWAVLPSIKFNIYKLADVGKSRLDGKCNL